jgi:hypothetical protein
MSLNPYAAMSLATITYDDEGGTLAQQKVAMSSDLSNLPGPAEGPWSLMWGPAANDGILAFVALNATKTQYAVAVRGSLSDEDAPGFIANWFDDFDALAQVPWLYPQTVSGAVISSGMNDALALLMAATDPATDLTLIDYLRTALAGSNAGLMVAGHSLGGALASLVAPWLHDQLPKTGTVTGVAITPYTFAAPTAGNLMFAQYYDRLFPVSYRGVNTQDIVPMGYANVSGMQAMFPLPSQTLWAYSKFLYGTVETAKVYMQGAGITYSQTNLGGAGTTDSFSGPPLTTLSFAYEAEAQHDHAVYLAHVTPPSKKA